MAAQYLDWLGFVVSTSLDTSNFETAFTKMPVQSMENPSSLRDHVLTLPDFTFVAAGSPGAAQIIIKRDREVESFIFGAPLDPGSHCSSLSFFLSFFFCLKVS